jgi:hypothetical protein
MHKNKNDIINAQNTMDVELEYLYSVHPQQIDLL